MRSMRMGKWELKTNIACFVQELAYIQGHFEKNAETLLIFYFDKLYWTAASFYLSKLI